MPALSTTPGTVENGSTPCRLFGSPGHSHSATRRKAPCGVQAGSISNLQMYKIFRLPKEGTSLKFGAEFYNAFNHTQFHDVNTSFGASAFGQVTDTYDPRALNSLKFAF